MEQYWNLSDRQVTRLDFKDLIKVAFYIEVENYLVPIKRLQLEVINKLNSANNPDRYVGINPAGTDLSSLIKIREKKEKKKKIKLGRPKITKREINKRENLKRKNIIAKNNKLIKLQEKFKIGTVIKNIESKYKLASHLHDSKFVKTVIDIRHDKAVISSQSETSKFKSLVPLTFLKKIERRKVNPREEKLIVLTTEQQSIIDNNEIKQATKIRQLFKTGLKPIEVSRVLGCRNVVAFTVIRNFKKLYKNGDRN